MLSRLENLIDKIANPEIIDEAYQYICTARRNTSHTNSVWWLRANWPTVKIELINKLRNNEYHFAPLARHKVKGELINCWEAENTIVLKAITIVLSKVLGVDVLPSCKHLKSNGGLKKTVREVQEKLKKYKFVFKSDVKSYYGSIDHEILLEQLAAKVTDRIVLRLLKEYCNRLVWVDGEYHTITQGISVGCSLSPLMAAYYLQTLDQALQDKNIYYVRYMDDFLVLARTRNHLRKAVRITNQVLSGLKLKKHPDKTYIGWIHKGFNFLGYRLNLTEIQLSTKTKQRFIVKISQFCEQGASKTCIGKYWRCWFRWALGGMNEQTKRYLFERDSFIDSARRMINNFIQLENTNENHNKVYFTDMLACLELRCG